MATTLTAVGFLVGMTGDRLLHRPRHGLVQRAAGQAPRLAGLAIVVAGCVLALRGSWQVV
jgi:hypothetical protein